MKASDIMEQYVVVTGAGHKNGIGYAIAEELFVQGYIPILADISFDDGLPFGYYTLDVADENEVSLFWDNMDDKNIVALANVAGITIIGKLVDYNLSDYEKTLNVNLIGPFLMSKYFVAAYPSSDIERYVINIGSDASNRPIHRSFAYCSSKAAL